jgi:hypothetical protein
MKDIIAANINSGLSRGLSMTVMSALLVMSKKVGAVCSRVVFMLVLYRLECSMLACENLTVSEIYCIE